MKQQIKSTPTTPMSMPMSMPEEIFWQVGQPYLIRTVTMIDTGVLVGMNDHEIILRDAAWIADDGRLSEALRTGNFSEVEMFPVGEPVIIGRTSLIDGVKIPKLPTETK